MRRPDIEDVAVHEASHIEVARSLGAYDLGGVVHDARRGGEFWGEFDGSREDEAVLLLAGAVGQEMLTGTRGNCREDMAKVRDLLRGSDLGVREARRLAEQQVQARRSAILCTASGLLARRCAR